jgi:hypothetical protein
MNDEEREYLNDTIRSLNNQLVDALRERDEMHRELRAAETECSMLRVECGVIAKERDEARRMYCEEVEHHHETVWNDGERDFKPLPALDVAISKGWDCFKENGK